METSVSTAPLYEPEHHDYRESVRTFLAREVVPSYRSWTQVPVSVLDAAREHGFLGMRVPEDAGGLGVDDLRFGVVVAEEAMLAGCPGLALVLALHNDVALPALLRAGVDPSGFATVLPRGLVNGRADMVVGGLSADHFVGIVDGRVAIFGRDAVTVEPADPSIGLVPAGLATVTCDNAEPTWLDGVDEFSIDLALMLAVTAFAGARAALRITEEYVADRKAFGQPLASFENTQVMLGRVAADIEVCDAWVDRAIRRRLDGALTPDAARAGRSVTADLYGRAVDTGVQLHGGYGYIMEYDIAHAFQDARLWRLAT